MKKIILSISLLTLCIAANAQSSDPKEVEGIDKPYPPKPESIDTENKIFNAVEQMPRFQGDIQQYLASTIKYPKDARVNNIQGRVITKFVVEKDGSITNAIIVRSLGSGCDEEVLRVVNAMPKWKPGYIGGKPVRTYYTLPVSFKLGK